MSKTKPGKLDLFRRDQFGLGGDRDAQHGHWARIWTTQNLLAVGGRLPNGITNHVSLQQEQTD